MNDPRPLSDRLRLEDLAPHHAEPLAAWLGQEEVLRWLPYLPQEVTPEGVLARLEGLDGDPSKREVAILFDGELAGVARLVCRDDERARAWVGSFEVALDPAFQGRGAGRAAVEALSRELYRWGKVEAILIGVLESNARALRLYESLGYREVERVWWDIRGARVRVLMLSDKPDRFTRRRVGFA